MLATLKRPKGTIQSGDEPDRNSSALRDRESLAREIESAAEVEAIWPKVGCGVTEDDSIGTFEVDLMDGWCKP